MRLSYFNTVARPLRAAAYPPESAPALRPTDKVAELPSSRSSGSYHWDTERLLSVVTGGLCVAPFIVGAGNAWVDFGLAFAIPLHTHIGLDAIVTDYLPYRKFGSVFTIASWALKGLTALVIYGAYSFNTNDIGITELVKKCVEPRFRGFGGPYPSLFVKNTYVLFSFTVLQALVRQEGEAVKDWNGSLEKQLEETSFWRRDVARALGVIFSFSCGFAIMNGISCLDLKGWTRFFCGLGRGWNSRMEAGSSCPICRELGYTTKTDRSIWESRKSRE